MKYIQRFFIFAFSLMISLESQGGSYLQKTIEALTLCEAEIPAMQKPADEAAARLAAGGNLWAAGQQSLVSELSGRAGGMMAIRPLGDRVPDKADVVLWGATGNDRISPTLGNSGAFVVSFGDSDVSDNDACFDNHADETGISPTMANLIPAWAFTGELVAALTRQKVFPVMYQTIGFYGGFQRIDKYQRKGIVWHNDLELAPVEPGVLGAEYLQAVKGLLQRIETEKRKDIDLGGQWIRDAKKNGHDVLMYTMGHFPPYEAEETAIGEAFETGRWNSGFRQEPPEREFAEGDVLIHIGYQHPPYVLLQRARNMKARVIYLDILQHRDYRDDPGVIWIDPMWSWDDACVELKGYDIPILPPSGIVNTAIAWEFYRLLKNGE